MTLDEDFDIPGTGAVFTFGKSRFAENAPSKFWIKNDIICKVVCGDEHTAIVTALKPQRMVLVACGRAHTIAASEIGSVFSWGYNGDGQLGIGNYEDKDFPVETTKLDSAPIQLAAGSSHSIVLTDKGELLVWGSNKEGQLGCEEDVLLRPLKLKLTQKIISLACGYYHTLTISDEGCLFSWGEKEHGKLGLTRDQLSSHKIPQIVNTPEKVAMVAAGSAHSIALMESGTVMTFGLGSSGQLGQGGVVVEEHSLKPVSEVEDQRFIYISAGDNHSAAISDTGFVYTWGCGRHGKLCLGEHNFSSHFSPVVVTRLTHLIAVQVASGGCHTMVLGYRRSEIETDFTPWAKEVRGRHISDRLQPLSDISKQTFMKEIVQPTPPQNTQTTTLDVCSDTILTPEQATAQCIGEEIVNQQNEEMNLNLTVDDESQKKARRFAAFWNAVLKRKKAATSPLVETETKPEVNDSANQISVKKPINSEANEFAAGEEPESKVKDKDGVGGKYLKVGCVSSSEPEEEAKETPPVVDLYKDSEDESGNEETNGIKSSKLCSIL